MYVFFWARNFGVWPKNPIFAIRKKCPRYPKFVHKLVRIRPMICPNCSKDKPKICPRFAQDMPMICRRYAHDMPKICDTCVSLAGLLIQISAQATTSISFNWHVQQLELVQSSKTSGTSFYCHIKVMIVGWKTYFSESF